MSVNTISGTSSALVAGGVWHMSGTVVDFDGMASDVLPVATITLPGGTTTSPAVEAIGPGVFALDYVTATAGRYTAFWTTAFGAAAFAAYATAVVPAADMPDLDEFKVYAGIQLLDTERDTEIVAALAAESAAQRAVCRVEADYPADLREALLRRTARNLALRLLPLAVLRGDGEAGSDTILPGRDPEIRRLEAPHRKRKMG